MKRIVFAAGGTGGHMIPAQVIAQEVSAKGHSVFFVGGKLEENDFFEKQHFSYASVSASPMTKNIPRFAVSLAKGFLQSNRFFTKCQPDLVIGFGSYHTFPVLFSAVYRKIPIVLFAADAHPGKVIRLFSSYARFTACYFKEALAHVKGKSGCVSFPLRKDFQMEISKEEALLHYHLPSDRKVLLVLGGSSGANIFNAMVPKVIGNLKTKMSIIHICGKNESVESLIERYRVQNIPCIVMPFESKMHLAYAAADCVIARGGASTVAEIQACRKKALYIPYPYAKDDHQMKNVAAVAKEQNCLILPQSRVSVESLVAAIESLIQKENPLEKGGIHISFVHALELMGLV